jgi:hypothetical protein
MFLQKLKLFFRPQNRAFITVIKVNGRQGLLRYSE